MKSCCQLSICVVKTALQVILSIFVEKLHSVPSCKHIVMSYRRKWLKNRCIKTWEGGGAELRNFTTQEKGEGWEEGGGTSLWNFNNQEKKVGGGTALDGETLIHENSNIVYLDLTASLQYAVNISTKRKCLTGLFFNSFAIGILFSSTVTKTFIMKGIINTNVYKE